MDPVVDTTETEASVSEVVDQHTAPVVPVSTQAPKPSDPDQRIRNLMSQVDKTTALYNSETLKNATLLNQLERQRIEAETQVAVHAEATRGAIDRAEALAKENADLLAANARNTFLMNHPDLLPYAKLVPATTDATQLETIAQEIKSAREQDLDATRMVFRNGGVIPPATPSKPSGTLTADDISQQLRAARESGNIKQFEELVAQFAKTVG